MNRYYFNLIIEKKLILSILALAFFVAFLFWFLPGDNNFVRLQDDVDGVFSTRHMIINSGFFFEPNPMEIVPGSMMGLPRASLPRFTNPFNILMFLFGTLNGYSITYVLIRLVAFFGIWFLGKDYFGLDNEKKYLLILLSVGFATLPFNPSYGLTVAGVPIVFWAYLNLMERKKEILSHIVLFCFAFSSVFVLVGFHICLILGLMTLFFSIMRKEFQARMLVITALFAVWFVLAEFMLFYLHFFADNYQSSRQSINKEPALNFSGVIGTALIYLFNGEYNASNFLGVLFIPIFVFGALTLMNASNQSDILSRTKLFFCFLLLCGFVAALLDWKGMKPVYEHVPLFSFFNFKRFITLIPGLFFIVLAALSSVILSRYPQFKYFIIILMVILFVFNWRGNISRLKSSFNCNGWSVNGDKLITFKEFMNTAQYQEIKRIVQVSGGGNVINFGITPAPCKYNGLRVLDDYQGDYPLTYKKSFRKIIEKEIDKSPALRKHFDEWGSKCYLYSANQLEGKLKTLKGFPLEEDLQINTLQLKEMNCRIILSSIIIGNAGDLGLKCEKVIVSNINFQTIFLYKVI